MDTRKIVSADCYDENELWKIEAMYSDPIYVFAESEQDALDKVVDESTHLDYLKVDTSDWTEEDFANPDGNTPLGNASEYFETDHMRVTCMGAVTATELVEAYLQLTVKE